MAYGRLSGNHALGLLRMVIRAACRARVRPPPKSPATTTQLYDRRREDLDWAKAERIGI